MKVNVKGFLNTKLLEPIRQQLTQGVSPLGLARTCAAGATISIIPLLGVTTTLCVLVGVRFKLNQALIQVVNYLLYPIQILMLPVFLILGAKVTGSPPVSLDPKQFASEFWQDPSLFMKHYGMAGFHAVWVWCFFSPIIFFSVQAACLAIFNRWKKE